MLKKAIILSILSCISIGTTILAETPDPLIIMRQVETTNDYKTNSGTMVMLIIDADNNKKTRSFNFKNKKTEKIDYSIVKFTKPKNIFGTGLLTKFQKETSENDQWLYLPAFKITKRIKGSEKAQSFMGSDFNYEDISFEKIDVYNYTYLKELVIDARKCHVVSAIPKNIQNSVYAKKIYYIDKEKNYPLQIDYFQEGQKIKYKQLCNKNIFFVKNYPIAKNAVMINLHTKSKTILKLSDVVYDAEVSEKEFTTSALEK